MAKGNLSPVKTEAFLARQKPKYGERALGQALSVRFSEEVDVILRQMSDRQEYIRRAVEAQLKADQLIS